MMAKVRWHPWGNRDSSVRSGFGIRTVVAWRNAPKWEVIEELAPRGTARRGARLLEAHRLHT
jgi:hypothetical protein